jgi:hypothetical protein
MIVLLAHPHLADAEFVGTGRLRHHVIDTIDGLRVGKQDNSSRHNNENAPADLDHPVLPRLSEASPRKAFSVTAHVRSITGWCLWRCLADARPEIEQAAADTYMDTAATKSIGCWRI